MKWHWEKISHRHFSANSGEVGFFRHSLPFVAAWAIGALLLLAIGWTTFMNSLNSERAAVEETALHEAETLADAYAERLYRSVQAIDQMTLFVKHGWETAGTSFRLESITKPGNPTTSAGFHISVIDRHGFLLSSTLIHPIAANASGQPYFTVHLRPGPDYLYIGGPHPGTFMNQTVIQFSRKLVTADGTFNGVVVVGVEPAYFITQFDEGISGKSKLIAILGVDKKVRIARIGERIFDAATQPISNELPLDSPSGRSTLPGEPWFSDARDRYAAWRTIEGYNMITFAGIDQQEIFGPYWIRHHNDLWYASIATALFLALSFLAMLAFARLSWRKHQFDAIQATYRAATEGGQEGFYIARPIEDASGETTDFKFIDCNERGASILKYRKEELIGKSIRSVYHGEAAKGTLHLLKHAMSTRHFSGEVKVRAGDPSGLSWLYVTVARPDGDLAVTLRDISDTKTHVTELERLTNEDTLTGLPNRHWLYNFLPGALESAAHGKHLLGLLFVDLDGFKSVNDTMGHEAGDELLRNAGRRLKEAIRPHDYVIRIGGDEFVVVIENMTHKSDASHVAERIILSFHEAFRLTKGLHSVGTSIGISVFPEDGQDADSLLKNADMAMYWVKTTGKRNYRFFDTHISEAVQSKHEIESELRHAIVHDQFIIHYQPRVDLASGEVSSMEALVRWAHPTKGLVEPASFIALAEETGLIIQIGEQVIDKVCAQLAFWSHTGQRLVPISINISPKQFHEVNMADTLVAALARYQVPASLIELELTESTMMGNSLEISEMLSRLQAMGVTLLVDDFGTGYSSLSQLQELDFDVLKVDKAFTARLEQTPAGKVFFSAIITMAHSLGMRVVAEGVETLEQIQSLKALRCDEIQGFYISKPLAPSTRQPNISDIAVHHRF
ncbi:EAL domain-containing protein [Noviherbaspirillum saxi]|uniref:EAL domain-containing protein n=1 Tax=Noviherbaspirillum saxi TaxID=2320863 RepID=A0A3A3FEL7_9BURK|nr:EAL domain-containing protein [Noviherbaspirillum saxi]RJF91786.1 EAL domain-containing protein [Noviherbaspirillum saxi]